MGKVSRDRTPFQRHKISTRERFGAAIGMPRGPREVSLSETPAMASCIGWLNAALAKNQLRATPKKSRRWSDHELQLSNTLRGKTGGATALVTTQKGGVEVCYRGKQRA
jgi:hypothetical protein